MPSLFDPIDIGDLRLANRVVMAPLTRNRAIDGLCPGPLTVEYYRQRATAGLPFTSSCVSAGSAHTFSRPAIVEEVAWCFQGCSTMSG